MIRFQKIFANLISWTHRLLRSPAKRNIAQDSNHPMPGLPMSYISSMLRRSYTEIDPSSILRKNDQPIGQQQSVLPLSLKRKEWQKRCTDERQPFVCTVITIASWIHLFLYSGHTSRLTKAPTCKSRSFIVTISAHYGEK
ncbi:hypothetical protein PoB_003112100 [Plakobranchus ocellatus]|uniref:Uncharacterized protein n=1 Tax=Plakobranchus ocellatus TaxID=259542 RepID=A0AAV4A075_9GAST|nr:hypothetical protein PoB_003112100 [Plakobranchus ocellatus]